MSTLPLTTALFFLFLSAEIDSTLFARQVTDTAAINLLTCDAWFKLRRIILPTAENLHIVELKDIIRAEADSNYTMFWLARGKKIMVSRTIKEFDVLLAGSGFIRVHQSFLVNIIHIDKFVKRGRGHLQMKNRN